MIRKKITATYKRQAQILRRRGKNGSAQFELLIRKTGQHMYATILDLITGKTLTTVSTVPVFKSNNKLTNKEASIIVGKDIALYCVNNSIVPAINIADHRFHGLVKELVDGFSNNLKN